MVFLPLDANKRAACETVFEKIVREEGQRVLGWRTVPVVASACGEIARRALPEVRQVFIGPGAGVADQEALERKLYVIRKRAFRAHRRSRAGGTGALLLLLAFDSDDCLQGPAHLAPDPEVLSRPARSRACERAGDGSSALLDQHVPDLGPGASVPLAEPQRRDQHAARKRSTGCMRGRCMFSSPLFGDDIAKLPADRRAHPDSDSANVRQRARAAGAHRAFAAARRDDDDPGGVAERRADEREQARVLRVSLLHDGAVGRSRLDRLHRRASGSARCSIATVCARRVTR